MQSGSNPELYLDPDVGCGFCIQHKINTTVKKKKQCEANFHVLVQQQQQQKIHSDLLCCGP